MMKNKKFNLDVLKVKSFIVATNLNMTTIKGGSGANNSIPDIHDGITVGDCVGTLNNCNNGGTGGGGQGSGSIPTANDDCIVPLSSTCFTV